MYPNTHETDTSKHIEARKLAVIFQKKYFQCIFFYQNYCIVIQISLKFVPVNPIDNIWFRYGLAPNKRQAITWTSNDQDHSAPLGHIKLKPWSRRPYHEKNVQWLTVLIAKTNFILTYRTHTCLVLYVFRLNSMSASSLNLMAPTRVLSGCISNWDAISSMYCITAGKRSLRILPEASMTKMISSWPSQPANNLKHG